MQRTCKARRIGGLLLAATVLAACGGDDDGATATSSTEPPASPATTEPPVDYGTVVVVGEEELLADVLALGIPVAASSAHLPDQGFLAMDQYDTEGIEIFDYLTTSLEQLATYQADHIVTWQFFSDQIDEEVLAGLGAELHVIPNEATGRDALVQLAAEFGREAQGEALLAELDAAYAAGRSEIPDDCAVSVAAVYPGPSVAAFADPIWDPPRVVDELGCTLVPGPGEVDTDRNGRAFLSLEQLGVLAGPELIMVQNYAVGGEREAVDEITANDLWAQLPAVAAGEVTEIDRLGYPGTTGEIRMITDVLHALTD